MTKSEELMDKGKVLAIIAFYTIGAVIIFTAEKVSQIFAKGKGGAK